jgi:glycyl-tRNA synthetase beta chain
VEVGTEELPASFVEPAVEELRALLINGLSQSRLSHGEAKVYATPRRLAALIASVKERADDLSKELVGPSVKVAFDKDGHPTAAAEKFAKGAGVPTHKLRRVSTPKGEYLAATVEDRGKDANQVLPGIVSQALHSLRFKKSMRWGDVERSFARPIHWIVALLGAEVIPVVFGDVRSGRTTYGHRFVSAGPIELAAPLEYVDRLRAASVIADPGERLALLLDRTRTAVQRAGGRLLEDGELVKQVVNLVELPNPVVGSFDRSFLDLPPEVLVQEMKSHQRYFSMSDQDGRLMPKFVAVSNTPVLDERLSLRGYERVLRSRLSDGRFFFDQDRKTRLIDRVSKLESIIFHHQLGTYAEKVARVRSLAKFVVTQTGLTQDAAAVDRAAILAKADLVTGMVGEFPELQGVMGREYAKADGEKPDVALAIFEHYLPRGANDSLPSQHPGALLGIADRTDTVCGIIAIGKAPSGAADPFGVRRSCLAIIRIILAKGYRLPLSQLVAESIRLLETKVAALKEKRGRENVQQQILEFFRARLKALWTEEHRPDLVEAVLSAGFDDIAAAKLRLSALSERIGSADFAPLAIAFRRVVNIVQKQGSEIPAGPARAEKLQEEAERRLHREAHAIRQQVVELVGADQYARALASIAELKPSVDDFFDRVMVMAEDPSIRENRVRLLREVGALFNYVADFSKIQADFGT